MIFMEIVKFKKDKGNNYKVYFNDDTILSLHDDVIVKYNLLTNRIINNDKFNEIVNYNDFLNGYYKSIKYINVKMRSEVEIVSFLKKIKIKKNEIDKIIKLLYKDGYLNREIYVKAYINDKFNLSNTGPIKLKKDLITLGYKENEFEGYLNSLDWYSRIDKIIDKKIKLNHRLSTSSLKAKILNEVIKLGYDKNDIISILEYKDFGDEYDYLKKELIKIKIKYSKKYSNDELYYKVVNYLYKKGFNLSDIKRCYDEN